MGYFDGLYGKNNNNSATPSGGGYFSDLYKASPTPSAAPVGNKATNHPVVNQPQQNTNPIGNFLSGVSSMIHGVQTQGAGYFNPTANNGDNFWNTAPAHAMGAVQQGNEALMNVPVLGGAIRGAEQGVTGMGEMIGLGGQTIANAIQGTPQNPTPHDIIPHDFVNQWDPNSKFGILKPIVASVSNALGGIAALGGTALLAEAPVAALGLYGINQGYQALGNIIHGVINKENPKQIAGDVYQGVQGKGNTSGVFTGIFGHNPVSEAGDLAAGFLIPGVAMHMVNGKLAVKSIEEKPQAVQNMVTHGNLQQTPVGQELLKTSIQAADQGHNVLIEPAKEGTQTPAGEHVQISTIDPHAEIQAKIEEPKNGYTSQLQKDSMDQLKQNPTEMRDAYIAKYDNEVNTDLARPFFNGYEGFNAHEVQDASRNLKNIVEDHLLNTRQGERNNTGLITGGGPGSGKSSALESYIPDKADHPIILDTTMSDSNSGGKIQKLIEKGYKARVAFVLRDPFESWANGVVPRAVKENRTVGEEYHLRAHLDALKNIVKVYNKYKDHPNVSFGFYDNRYGAGQAKPMSIDDLANVRYNEGELRKAIHEHTDQALQSGEITDQHYQGLTNDRQLATGLPERTQQGNSQESGGERQGEKTPATQTQSANDTTGKSRAALASLTHDPNPQIADVASRFDKSNEADPSHETLIHTVLKADSLASFTAHLPEINQKFDNAYSSLYDDIRNGAITEASYQDFRKSLTEGKASEASDSSRQREPIQAGNEQVNGAHSETVGDQTNSAHGNQNGESVKPNASDTKTTSSTSDQTNPEYGKSTASPEGARDTTPGRGAAAVDEIGKPQGEMAPSVQFNAGVDPGLVKFFKGDVAPAVTTLREAGSEVHDVINPPKASTNAAYAANIIRDAQAKIANYRSIIATKYGSYEKFFNKYSDEQNIKNISHFEQTGEFAVKPDQNYTKLYHDSMAKSYEVLKAAYGSDHQGFIDNYVRRAFVFGSKDDEAKGVTELQNYYRSLSASKSPLKGRVLDMPLDEALKNMQDRGIKVKMASTNPETLRQWSLMNAQRALSYAKAWNEAKASKLITFVKNGGEIPSGAVRLNDRAAEVFAPAEVRLGENGKPYDAAVSMGRYYADPNVARVFNNTISKGLEGSATFRGARMIENMLNTFQLGLSAFHATGVAIDAGVSDVALGLRAALKGHPIEATKRISLGAVPFGSFAKDIYQGQKFLSDLQNDSPEAHAFLEKVLNPAGGRLGQDVRYREDMWDKLSHDLINGNPIGATIKLPQALVEKLGHPLMGMAIPRVKIGAFMDLAKSKLDNLPGDATAQQRQQALVEAWTSIDNRFGQLVYDNLFWNKVGKDLAMFGTRSVGWNLGTVRELGGAVMDMGQTLKGKGVTDRQLYAASLVLTTATVGAIYQYLHTGTAPQELKDYFHPQNGLIDKNGNKDRISLPTYMKDVFAYTSDPISTVLNKTSPLLSSISQLVQNHDYYGNLIRNPNDPVGTQLSQLGEFALKNFLPFSITQLLNQRAIGASPEQQAEAFMGITKAPQSVIQSDAQKKANAAYEAIHGLPGAKTPEQVQLQQLKSKAYQEIKQDGWQKSPSFHELMQNGTLKTQRQRIDFIKNARLTPQQRLIKSLPKSERGQFGATH